MDCLRLSSGILLGVLACGSGHASSSMVKSQATPSAGNPAECGRDQDCKSDAVDGLLLAGATPAPLSSNPCVVHFVSPPMAGAQGVLSSPHSEDDAGVYSKARLCDCTLANGSDYLLAGGNGAACEFVGRRGQCLFSRDEFGGCSPDDSTTCDSPCTLLLERLRDNARPATDAVVRSKRCIDNRCSLIFEVEGKCFLNHVDQSVDCSLSDDEIRTAARP